MARNSLPRKLRQTPTLAEVRFWRLLYPVRQMGWHFRKQAPMGRYVVDFVCHSARLIVEIDGETHFTEQAPPPPSLPHQGGGEGWCLPRPSDTSQERCQRLGRMRQRARRHTSPLMGDTGRGGWERTENDKTKMSNPRLLPRRLSETGRRVPPGTRGKQADA